MEVKIKKTSGDNFEEYTVALDDINSATVRELKQAIKKACNIPVWSQRLIFGGKQLEKKNALLTEYGASQDSLQDQDRPILLVVRLSPFRFLREQCILEAKKPWYSKHRLTYTLTALFFLISAVMNSIYFAAELIPVELVVASTVIASILFLFCAFLVYKEWNLTSEMSSLQGKSLDQDLESLMSCLHHNTFSWKGFNEFMPFPRELQEDIIEIESENMSANNK